MFHSGFPKITRHHPWGVATDTHAIAYVSAATISAADKSVNAFDNFAEEPRPAFRLVDPYFNQAGGRHVVMAIA